MSYYHDYDPMFDEPEEPDTVCTTTEMANHLGASGDDVGSLRRRVYKDTACGASLGVFDGNEWLWSDGSKYTGPVYGLAMCGYVEDCDAECPVRAYDPAKDGTWNEWLDWAMKQVDVDADDVAAEWQDALRYNESGE